MWEKREMDRKGKNVMERTKKMREGTGKEKEGRAEQYKEED